MNHRHVRPSADHPVDSHGSTEPESAGGHGGWGMAGMMLLCCIPMIIVVVWAVANSR
jgi:hypothetical protein